MQGRSLRGFCPGNSSLVSELSFLFLSPTDVWPIRNAESTRVEAVGRDACPEDSRPPDGKRSSSPAGDVDPVSPPSPRPQCGASISRLIRRSAEKPRPASRNSPVASSLFRPRRSESPLARICHSESADFTWRSSVEIRAVLDGARNVRDIELQRNLLSGRSEQEDSPECNRCDELRF